jgi:hypothetical protein
LFLFVRAEEAVKEEGKEEGLRIAFSKFASFPFRRRFFLLRLSKKQCPRRQPLAVPPQQPATLLTPSRSLFARSRRRRTSSP